MAALSGPLLRCEALLSQLPEVGEMPNQPLFFPFPKREYRKTIAVKHLFLGIWWQWLHYDEAHDLVFLPYLCNGCQIRTELDSLLGVTAIKRIVQV